MKNSLILGAALLTALSVTAPAHAQYRDSNVRSSDRDWARNADSRVYVGLYGGYGWTDADVSGGPSLDVNGADWGILAGYEALTLFEDFGMSGAVEAYYGWSHADGSSAGTSIDKKNEWGLRFRPGLRALAGGTEAFQWNPYAILGYRRATFETNTPSGTEEFNGFELGIGTQLVTRGDYGIRLDYAHVFYSSEAGISPDEDNLRLTLSYHF